ncbi:hypothetical protein [Parasulfitobacter algicola]|uniref:Uncharacterized protein n=1 Tax=Parasulfitobacter algicola TaxID=2614809 RepID=A0ABX2ISG0_9RHOB|nr:hypothetical protein [Sulfitobacter algicola]NSX53226.1 hypothetical protein [Sulfitobacter algicola]
MTMFDLDELTRWDDALASISEDVSDAIRGLRQSVQEVPEQVRNCPLHRMQPEMEPA